MLLGRIAARMSLSAAVARHLRYLAVQGQAVSRASELLAFQTYQAACQGEEKNPFYARMVLCWQTSHLFNVIRGFGPVCACYHSMLHHRLQESCRAYQPQ